MQTNGDDVENTHDEGCGCGEKWMCEVKLRELHNLIESDSEPLTRGLATSGRLVTN
jgi:hypothetical protein